MSGTPCRVIYTGTLVQTGRLDLLLSHLHLSNSSRSFLAFWSSGDILLLPLKFAQVHLSRGSDWYSLQTTAMKMAHKVKGMIAS